MHKAFHQTICFVRNLGNQISQLLVWDAGEGRPKLPGGSVGSRWAEREKGHWNLVLEDITDGHIVVQGCKAVYPEPNSDDEFRYVPQEIYVLKTTIGSGGR